MTQEKLISGSASGDPVGADVSQSVEAVIDVNIHEAVSAEINSIDPNGASGLDEVGDPSAKVQSSGERGASDKGIVVSGENDLVEGVSDFEWNRSADDRDSSVFRGGCIS